jgi:hypothetical protein
LSFSTGSCFPTAPSSSEPPSIGGSHDAAALALDLVESDRLAAAGRTEQMAGEVTKIYETAAKAFEEQKGQQ